MLLPGDVVGFVEIDPVPVLLLAPGPDRFDPVEVWPVGDVPNESDVHLVAVLEDLIALVNGGVVQEEGVELVLVLSLGVEAPKELEKELLRKSPFG